MAAVKPRCPKSRIGIEGIPERAETYKCPKCGLVCHVIWPPPEKKKLGHLPQLEYHSYGENRRRACSTRH
jgi:hypothetical protein